MGTFMGHFLPGSFLMVFGIWWTIRIFQRHFRSLLPGGPPFRSTVTFPCTCVCGLFRYWEVEGFIKIVFCTIGFIGEIVTGFHDGHWAFMGNGQHATMFFFFGFSGFIDIMVHHGKPLPQSIEYMAMLLTFIVEGILFNFHLHGRGELDVLIHTLLLYTVMATIVIILIEMAYRKHMLPIFARAYLVLLQGTWFIHVGFILYNPYRKGKGWEQDNHDQMTFMTMMFAWHMAADLIVMLVIGGLVACCFQVTEYGKSSGYDPIHMQLLRKEGNGHTIINLNEESESDVDFEQPLTEQEQEQLEARLDSDLH